MRPASQILLSLASFLVVFILGNLFGEVFAQAAIHAAKTLDGKPLPPLSAFLFQNPRLAGHLALLPWLGLAGLPLLTRTGAQNYWEVRAFCFRYLVFLAAELFLCFIFLLAVALPFLPHYITPLGQASPGTTVEWTFRAIFWLGVLLGLGVAGWRWRQAGARRAAEIPD